MVLKRQTPGPSILKNLYSVILGWDLGIYHFQNSLQCSTSLVIRKIGIKTTMWFHCTPISMAKVWMTDNTKNWQGYETIVTLIHYWRECQWVHPLWKTTWQYRLELHICIPLTLHNDSLVNTPQKCIHRRIFIAILLIIVPEWKQPKCQFMQWSNIPYWVWMTYNHTQPHRGISDSQSKRAQTST